MCMLFFVKQKTAYDVRMSDGSSDVCSSDLSGVVESLDPQHRFDSRHERGLINGLRQVLVGACLQASDDILGIRLRRHHHDRHDRQRGSAFKAAARSDECRVGQEGVSTWRPGWLPANKKEKRKKRQEQ